MLAKDIFVKVYNHRDRENRSGSNNNIFEARKQVKEPELIR
jgi:hypothetical protein